MIRVSHNKVFHKLFSVLVCFSLCMAVPCITATVVHAAEIVTINCNKRCEGGSVQYTSEGQHGEWHYKITGGTKCEHGSYKEHNYDSSTELSAGVFDDVSVSSDGHSIAFSSTGSPFAPRIVAIKTTLVEAKSTIEADLASKGITATITSLQAPTNGSYYVYGMNYSIAWKSNTHAPISVGGISLDDDNKLLDLYSGTLEVNGMNILTPITCNTSALNNLQFEAYQNLSSTRHTCTASTCPTGDAVITGGHKGQYVVSTDSGNYYDNAGKVIGGWSSSHNKCGFCGADWTEGGAGITQGYEGDVFNKDGVNIGHVGSTGTTGSNNKYGPDLTYLRGGYSYSTEPSVSTNGCYTVTYNPCQKHHMIGTHYYCEEHGYVGFEKEHYWSINKNLYEAEVYGYVGDDKTISVFQSLLSTDTTCSAYLDYVSTVAGHIVTVTMTQKPEKYKYTVITASGRVIAQAETSASTFSYTMPAEKVTVNIEQARKPQTIAIPAAYTKTYNSGPFNLGVTIS